MSSLVFNMVGGSGGLTSTDAILRVQAPAGSTVTISKGGATKSDVGHENAINPSTYDYYFIIHASQFDSVNAWTVTATLGADTTSDTVIIDTADEYDVVLHYVLYLYNLGDECANITGGWAGRSWLGSSSSGYTAAAPTVTKNASSMVIKWANSKSGVCQVLTDIDLTGFSTIHADVGAIGASTISARLTVVARNATYWYSNRVAQIEFPNAGSSDVSTDISSITGSYDIVIGATNNTGSTYSAQINRIWLGK